MKAFERHRIVLLRIGYWTGIVLDAVAFTQMAFPAIGKRMLGITRELGPEYIFAINLAAGLMLAWTILLFWADRRPLERRGVVPLTMIIIAWNVATMIYGVRAELVPAATMLPQLVLAGALFLYYGFCFIATVDHRRQRATPVATGGA